MQVDTLLTENMRTPIRADGISKKTCGQRIKTNSTVLRRVLFLSSNPEFYHQYFRPQVILNMDAHSNPRKALKSAQEQEDQRQCRNERDRARCAAETAKD